MIITIDDFKIWKFPNGEWGVTAPTGLHPDNKCSLVLNWKWPDPLNIDLMLLMMCIDSLSIMYGRDIKLNLTYLPYSRQDRSFEFGNCVGSKVFTKIVAEEVFLHAFQPHVNFGLYDLKLFNPPFRSIFGEDEYYVVSPDLNAPEYKYSSYGENIKFSKRRLPDGEIELTCMTANIDLSRTTKAVIFDDLCDGGASFIACSSKLRQMGFKEIWLCVAHGFFTKGVDHLYENGIDGIITTDSVCRLEATDKLIILDAFEEME